MNLNIKSLPIGTIVFTKWKGDDGIQKFIKNRTNCNPFSGAGINYYKTQNTCIIKSVDNTYYYKDDLTNINYVDYTLFGHNNDQSEKEPYFNEPLLNNNKTKYIYLYRVIKHKSKSIYIWYGKYNIIDKKTEQHIGKNYLVRNIIILKLKRV